MLEPQLEDNIELYTELLARTHYGWLAPLLSHVSHAASNTFKAPTMKEIIMSQNVIFGVRAILTMIFILNPDESLNIIGGIL